MDKLRDDRFLLEEYQRMVRRHASDSNDNCWFGRKLDGIIQEICHCFECYSCNKKLDDYDIRMNFGDEYRQYCEKCFIKYEDDALSRIE